MGMTLNLWRCKSCGDSVYIKKSQLCKRCYHRERSSSHRIGNGIKRMKQEATKKRLEQAELIVQQRSNRALMFFERYMDGESLTDIAKSEGLSSARVSAILKAEGLPTQLPKINAIDNILPRSRKMFRVLAMLDTYIDRKSEDECWEWKGASYPNPACPHIRYARIRAFDPLDADEPRITTVHRVMHLLHKGPIPEGMVVDHICFNTLCCNPAHLQLLTRAENSARKNPRRMSSKGDRDKLAG